MRVRVHQRRVNMGVSVRLPSVPCVVRVLMMLVVDVGMAVLLWFVRVQMPVPFGQM